MMAEGKSRPDESTRSSRPVGKSSNIQPHTGNVIREISAVASSTPMFSLE